MNRPLIIALHGVGSTARDMALAVAPLEAIADVVSLDGTDAFDGGGLGRQWFSVHGVTEADRPHRVMDALPTLFARLDRLASDHGVARKDLVLLGFSQGAIMTLAMVAQGLHAGRAIAVAGRLAAPVASGDIDAATLLLVHDRGDPVMPVELSAVAKLGLAAGGHYIDIAYTEGIGHGIGPATMIVIAQWLSATAASQTNSSIKGRPS